MKNSKLKNSEVFVSIALPLNKERLVNVLKKRDNLNWLKERTGFKFK